MLFDAAKRSRGDLKGKEKMGAEKRSNSMDVLRVIAMFLIVCVHSYSMSGLMDSLEAGTRNFVLGNLAYTPGLVATNCFVLVSGYYHCTSGFKLRRIGVMWLEVFVYSVGVFVFACLRDPDWFSLEALASALLPVSSKRYWFVTAYVLLQLLAPFLNMAIRAMDRRAHLLCCLTLTAIFCVWGNLSYSVFRNDMTELAYGYSVYWFCVLYILAAYFRKYVPNRIKGQKWMLWGYVLLVVLTALSRVLFYQLPDMLLTHFLPNDVFSLRYSVLLLPASLCIFQFFRGGGTSGKIEKLASAVYPLIFAVYLLHCNDYMNSHLWSLLGVDRCGESPWMVVYALGCSALIFVCCCAIEWVRRRIFTVLRIDSAFARLCDTIQCRAEKTLDKCFPDS